MDRVPLIAAVGSICATALIVGLGFFVPVSGAVGGFFDFVAVGSAVVFVGLLDGQ
jgi:hypothetical protein